MLENSSSRWLINGVHGNNLPADDRGLAYGDGLFETMRSIGTKIPLRAGHEQRLIKGCTCLGIEIDSNRLNKDLDAVLAKLGGAQSLVKIIVTRGGPASGYAQRKNLEPNLYIRYSPLELPIELLGEVQQIPLVSAQLCHMRLGLQPALAGVKHLNRLEQVLAAAEIQEPNKEGILLDTQGRVVEAISSNLIAVIDGVLHFPDLSSSGVAGVMQRFLLEIAEREGLAVRISSMNFDRFCEASEILICNSVRGVRNIERIDVHWLSQNTAIGSRLRELIRHNVADEFYSF